MLIQQDLEQLEVILLSLLSLWVKISFRCVPQYNMSYLRRQSSIMKEPCVMTSLPFL